MNQSSTYHRFSKLLDMIQGDEHSSKTEARIESFVRNDTRNSIFRLEAIFKVFAEHPEFGEEFKKGLKRTKEFEDYLGWYKDALDFKKKVSELKVSDKVLASADQRIKTKHQDLVKFLEEHWTPEKEKEWRQKYKSHFEQITGVAEHDFVLDQIIAHVTKVRTSAYDLTKMDEGLHHYRRNLRWVLLMLQAWGGFFSLEDNAELESRYNKYLDKSGVRESPFSKIPVIYPESRRCKISRPLFEMITLAVFKIGDAKDWGVLQNDLEAALKEAGRSPAEAKSESWKIASTQPGYQEPLKVGQKWKSILDDEDILGKLNEELRACVK